MTYFLVRFFFGYWVYFSMLLPLDTANFMRVQRRNRNFGKGGGHGTATVVVTSWIGVVLGILNWTYLWVWLISYCALHHKRNFGFLFLLAVAALLSSHALAP